MLSEAERSRSISRAAINLFQRLEYCSHARCFGFAQHDVPFAHQAAASTSGSLLAGEFTRLLMTYSCIAAAS